MILDELAIIHTWGERFNYLMVLSEESILLPPEERTSDNRIDGCTSATYLKVSIDTHSRIFIESYSNASIPYALTYLLREVYNGLTKEQAVALGNWYARPIGDNPTPIIEALTPLRSLAFINMIKRITIF